MGIPLISDIEPKNNGAFPTHSDIHGKGGYQVRDTIVDRDNIPTLNRKEGMIVKIEADGYYYTLDGGITNSNWIPLDFPVQNGGNVTKTHIINFFAGITSTYLTIFSVAGSFYLNLNDYKSANGGIRTIKFRVILETTSPTATVRLYNYTTHSIVSGSILVTNSLTPDVLITSDLSGVINTTGLYQVQIQMATEDNQHRVTLSSAQLEINWI